MASKILSKAELQANRIVVLSTYRQLLRATRIAFNNDDRTLIASRQHARAQFEGSRNLETGSVQSAQAVEHAQGVTKILRENVVQGKNTGRGTYKLNIHEHTERGDNDTAGRLKGTSKTWKEVKNAAF